MSHRVVGLQQIEANGVWASGVDKGGRGPSPQSSRENISSSNCTKFASLIIVASICRQISYFKAKMHPIRFRLELRLRPRWGSSQRSPDPLAVFQGVLLLREGTGEEEGKTGEKRGKREGHEEEGCKGKEKRWKETSPPPIEISVYATGLSLTENCECKYQQPRNHNHTTVLSHRVPDK